jgi:hypothetical protein
VPDGVYQVFIAELEETASKNGKLMYNARLEIMEPTDFAGMGIFEAFVIGSEEDPDAAEDATWVKAFGARRLKNMLKAAQVPMDTDMDNIIAAALQQQLVISATQEVDTGERDPQYKGRVRNRINAFYQLGHKEVGLTEEAAPAPKKALAAVPKAPAPAAKPAAPKAAAPAPRAPAPAPRAPAPQAAAPRPAPAAAKPRAAGTAHCSICNTDVARAEFVEHVEAHANEG